MTYEQRVQSLEGNDEHEKNRVLTEASESSTIKLNRNAKRKIKNLSNFTNLEFAMQERNVINNCC